MNKQSEVYFHKRVLLRDEILKHAMTWMNLEDMLRERSYTKVPMLYDSFYIRYSEYFHGDKKQINRC